MKRTRQFLEKGDLFRLPSTTLIKRKNYTDSEKIDLLLEKVSNLEEALNSVANLLGQLTDDFALAKRDENNKSSKIHQRSLAECVLPQNPFCESSQFFEFEEKIKSDDKFETLTNEFYNITSKHGRDFVAKCWRKVFIDNLAKHFSWQGTSEKGSVRSLATTVAISSAFRKRYPYDRYAVFEDKTKKFFQYAKDRETKTLRYRESMRNANKMRITNEILP